ncbi:MAG: TetR/AcrR family transcriptional regulator [Ilumatobacteraceae bacterium]
MTGDARTIVPGPHVAPKRPVRKLGRPPRVKAHDTRRRLLDIARGVYAERGFEAATNKEIADLAHMTTAALYYHFPSKHDLYLAVHEDAREQVYNRFEEVVRPDDSFAEQLLAVLNVTHELNAEDPTLAQFLAAARTDMKRRPELYDALEHRARFRNDFFDRIIDTGVRTGEIAPENRQLVRAFIIAMVTGMTDALSDDQAMHLQAIEAVKAIIAGGLVRSVDQRKSARRKAG